MDEREPLPTPNLLREAVSICEDARRRGMELRLFGGLAIQFLCSNWLEEHPAIARASHDIDLVTRSADAVAVREFLNSRGYGEAAEVRIFSEGRRMTFHREEFLVDVVVDALEYCHRIVVADSFDQSFPTLDPANLLLSKAQRVDPRRADLADMTALLCSEVSSNIDWDYLRTLLGRSWTLWHTVSRSEQRLASFIESELRDSGCGGLEGLSRCLADCPRTVAWRVRATFGTLLPWHIPVDALTIEQKKNGKGG